LRRISNKRIFIKEYIKKNEQINKNIKKEKLKILKIFIDGNPLKKIKIKFKNPIERPKFKILLSLKPILILTLF
tara:strand:- start:382 stop:603 length:222 start_codon:yes stop_codon:yes gene_type:complete